MNQQDIFDYASNHLTPKYVEIFQHFIATGKKDNSHKGAAKASTLSIVESIQKDNGDAVINEQTQTRLIRDTSVENLVIQQQALLTKKSSGIIPDFAMRFIAKQLFAWLAETMGINFDSISGDFDRKDYSIYTAMSLAGCYFLLEDGNE